MYGETVATGSTAGAALAMTGMEVGWAVLAAFTVVVVGGALMRLVPKKES